MAARARRPRDLTPLPSRPAVAADRRCCIRRHGWSGAPWSGPARFAEGVRALAQVLRPGAGPRAGRGRAGQAWGSGVASIASRAMVTMSPKVFSRSEALVSSPVTMWSETVHTVSAWRRALAANV